MVEIRKVLVALAKKRSTFHSEAEFQNALAWEIQQELPEASVHLEFPVEVKDQSIHVDIWTMTQDEILAIELKYKTRGLSVLVNGEEFFLKDQAAQDLGRYDLLKDVQRLEQVTNERRSVTGYAILLTNDSAYWKPPAKPHTAYADFSIEDGRTLEGALNCGVNASLGTRKDRDQPIVLRGKYPVKWESYSHPSPATYGLFRSLTLKVTQGQDAG